MSVIEVPIELRWADQDAYGHINNVAAMRLLEEARARAFWRGSEDPQDHGIFPPLTPDQPTWAVVADFRITYRQQLDYQREPVIVSTSISKIGGASFVIDYSVRTSPTDPNPPITAESTMVLVARATGKPQRIDAETRALMQQYSGDGAS